MAPAPATAEEIRDVNTRYHDGGGRRLRRQVGHRLRRRSAGRRSSASCARRSARGAAASTRSLEIGAGTGYFSLNLLRAGVVGARDVHRHLARDARRAAAPTPSASASTWRPCACDAEDLPFEDGRFDLVFGHAVLHHLPDLDQAFSRVPPRAAPGRAARASPASRRATATASPRTPSARADRCRPLWRRLLRAAPAADGPPATAAPPNHAARGASSTSTPSRPTSCARFAAARGLRRRPRARRGAAGQLVRLGQPHAGGDGRPRRRSRGPGRSYAFRGYLALQQVDRRLLEPRLPPAIFYNLILSARKPGYPTPGALRGANSSSRKGVPAFP